MEIYRCNWSLFLQIVAFIVLVGGLGYWQYGVNEHLFNGLLISLVPITIGLYHQLTTTLAIVGERNLVMNQQSLGGGVALDIQRLVLIDRIPTLLMKTSGGRLQFYVLNDENKPMTEGVAEGNFKTADIKSLLSSLKRINPRIELHPHYAQLIEGKIAVKEFEHVELDRNSLQAGKELRAKLEEKGARF
jgi:hypothetical protein